jgi:branched-chain amino acid transport system permease protein
MAFGTMIVILFTWYLQSNGITLGFLPTAILAIPIGIIFTVAISLFFDKTVFEYYREKKSNPVTFIVVSLGIMFVLNAVVRIIIGPNDINFMDGHKFVIKASEFKKLTGLDEGLAIKSTQVITLITTIISCSLLFYFLNKTKTGKSMRAYSNNEDLALLSGINPKKIIIITWVIVSILATIAGTLYGLDKSFKPFTYFNNLLPIFAATIVGGIGNPLGAFYGGFLIAFSEIALTYAYKKFLGYLLPESLEPNTLIQFISTDYKFAISFAILVIVLIFRPNGIFKGKVI